MRGTYTLQPRSNETPHQLLELLRAIGEDVVEHNGIRGIFTMMVESWKRRRFDQRVGSMAVVRPFQGFGLSRLANYIALAR